MVIGDGQRIGWHVDNPDLWEHLQSAFTHLPSPPQVVWRRLPLPEAIRVVPVMDRLRVLVVDAAPTARLLDRPAAFVALGLLPDAPALVHGATPDATPATTTPNAAFLVAPDMAAVAELAGREGLGDYSAIVLADVPQLPAGTADRLASYVAEGGGLLVAVGGRAQKAFYNDWDGSAGTVMPLPLEELVVATDTNRPSPDSRTFTHVALKPLAAGSDLDAAQIERYWLTGEGDADARIGGRLVNGAPCLAERAYGRGRVLQVNAPLDLTAGNLVARQSFVPFVHELIYHLARPVAANLNVPPARGATIPLTGDVGERLAAGGATALLTVAGPGLTFRPVPAEFLSPTHGRSDASAAGIETMVQGPARQPLPGRYVTGEDGIALRLDVSLVPGLYHAAVPLAVQHKVNRLLDADGTIPFSVLVDGEESRRARPRRPSC